MAIIVIVVMCSFVWFNSAMPFCVGRDIKFCSLTQMSFRVIVIVNSVDINCQMSLTDC